MQTVRSYSPDATAVAPGRNDAPKIIARDLFAVPVVVCQWPAVDRLNEKLYEAVMQRHRTSPGVVVSNRNGWHSETDLHRWPEESIAELLRMIETAAAQMVLHLVPDADEKYLKNWKVSVAWANVNPAGGHNRAHNHVHGGGQLSGVYYVDIGKCETPSHAGRIIFQDRSGVAEPLKAGRDLAAREYALVPTPGTMVLFPAAQFHYVEPYRGETQRMSIAFNIHHPEFGVLYYPDMLETGWWQTNFKGLLVIKKKLPEKFRALTLFASYAAKEIGRSDRAVPLMKRLKAALGRAQVDASAETEGTHIDSPSLPLPQKNQIV